MKTEEGKGTTYFDLDCVLRDLHGAISDKLGMPFAPTDWREAPPGHASVIDFVDNNRLLLASAPVTEYWHEIMLARDGKPITVITCSPITWIPYTRYWLAQNMPRRTKIIWCQRPEGKLELLGPHDWLVEDYPGFSDYSRIILIDRPYNRNVAAPVRVKTPAELGAVLRRLKREGNRSCESPGLMKR
jgi:hypothetical protein